MTLQIPPDAVTPCSRPGCPGSYAPVPGEEPHFDEGDGGAMIGTSCTAGCGMSSYHGWVPSDAEYEAYFGHAFGDDGPGERWADTVEAWASGGFV